MADIHATAVIDPGVELGADVSVGPFTYIACGARIGDGCRIGPGVTIHGFARIGRGVRIHAGAVIADEPQDLGFENADSFVEIGDACWIREHVTIHRGSKAGSVTVVGPGCMLMAGAHLAHNVQLGEKVMLVSGVLLAGYVQVGDRAIMSGNSGAHQFTRIGRLALVSANTVVTQDVPPFCVTPHVTSNRVIGLNVIGMRRAGMSADERREVRRVFKAYYREGLSGRTAVSELERRFPSGPAHDFVEFIKGTRRGVCRYGRSVIEPDESGD